MLTKYIRRVIKRNYWLHLELKKASSKFSAFQYVFNTFSTTVVSLLFFEFVAFLAFRKSLLNLVVACFLVLFLYPVVFRFWLSLVRVQSRKLGRELEADLMFVAEFLYVEVQSGIPLGLAIEKLSKFKRPSGKFFKKIYLDFKTGKDLQKALEDAYYYCPSKKFKKLLKKLRDSLFIGVNLKGILETVIEEASEESLIQIKYFSKTMNPLIMMYLILGIVFPSLGVTLFILGASVMNLTPMMLKLILFGMFVFVFVFQYMAFSTFKYKKDVIKL